MLRLNAQKKNIPFKLLLLIDNAPGHPRALTEIYKINVAFRPAHTHPFCSPQIRSNFDFQPLLEASLVAQRLKRLPPTWETQVRSLGQEDPLEKEMATHSIILAWRIPWMEELGGLQSIGCKESDTTERLHFHMQTIPPLWQKVKKN